MGASVNSVVCGTTVLTCVQECTRGLEAGGTRVEVSARFLAWVNATRPLSVVGVWCPNSRLCVVVECLVV